LRDRQKLSTALKVSQVKEIGALLGLTPYYCIFFPEHLKKYMIMWGYAGKWRVFEMKVNG
jgi:hypothetical protein